MLSGDMAASPPSPSFSTPLLTPEATIAELVGSVASAASPPVTSSGTYASIPPKLARLAMPVVRSHNRQPEEFHIASDVESISSTSSSERERKRKRKKERKKEKARAARAALEHARRAGTTSTASGALGSGDAPPVVMSGVGPGIPRAEPLIDGGVAPVNLCEHDGIYVAQARSATVTEVGPGIPRAESVAVG